MNEYAVKVKVDNSKLLSYYNSRRLDENTINEVEDYLDKKRPYTEKDIPLLLSYHLLGNMVESVEVD